MFPGYGSSADEGEPSAIPGFGPVLARRMIAHRPFRDVDDLGRVEGIGEDAADPAPAARDGGVGEGGHRVSRGPGRRPPIGLECVPKLEVPLTMSTTDTPSFAGLRVATFESRMSGPIADLIAKYGGVPVEAPALREIPHRGQPRGPRVRRAADRRRVRRGDLPDRGRDPLPGPGDRDPHPPRDLDGRAGGTKVVVRGPKPLAPLRELKARVDLQAPEPNTWHEVLALLDAQLPVAGLRVAVQEYGKPNPELIEGLERRGAAVTRVPVYRWALPEDTGPLRRAIAEIAAGRDRRRAVHLGSAGRAPAPGRGRGGARGRPPRGPGAGHRRRLGRPDHVGDAPRARPAGRHRARAPQDGPPGRRRRRRLAARSARPRRRHPDGPGTARGAFVLTRRAACPSLAIVETRRRAMPRSVAVGDRREGRCAWGRPEDRRGSP